MVEKIAPVQGYSAGIPWSLHLRAYDAYCKRWGAQPALIDLEGRGCRGGFGTGELDMLVPGWRDEVSEIGRLKAALAQACRQRDDAIRRAEKAEEALAKARAMLRRFQWAGTTELSDGGYEACCPCCEWPERQSQHAPGCDLAAEIIG